MSERERSISCGAPGAILLDAMGTLVTFAAPAPRLRRLLAQRHGVVVEERCANAAMRAEIAVYRREHLAAGTRTALDALRLRCATVLRDALGPSAADLDPAGLVPTLLDALVFEPYPEVAEVLGALRARGHALAVVSNWDLSLHDVLRDTGLHYAVDVVVASAQLGAAKPDPLPLRHALDRLGAVAESAWHVGDSVEEDIAGALAAGVRPVLLARGASDASGDQARCAVATRPDVAVISDLRGLPALAA